MNNNPSRNQVFPMPGKLAMATPWGCWGRGPFPSIEEAASKFRKWNNGVIHTHAGKLCGVWGRCWPFYASHFGMWLERRWDRLPEDHCWLHFSRPRHSPDFLSLRYIHSGRRTRLSTAYRALVALDELAIRLESFAIVCCAINERLSESMMARWGYVRHAHALPGNHFIKRFRSSLETENSISDATIEQFIANHRTNSACEVTTS